MEATVLDQGRKTSKKCQIEGCHEITVGSRTALCRKHRNNKYKQNYNKKRKRKALGPEEIPGESVESQLAEEKCLMEQKYASMLQQVLAQKQLELLQSEKVIQVLRDHQQKVKQDKIKEIQERKIKKEQEPKETAGTQDSAVPKTASEASVATNDRTTEKPNPKPAKSSKKSNQSKKSPGKAVMPKEIIQKGNSLNFPGSILSISKAPSCSTFDTKALHTGATLSPLDTNAASYVGQNLQVCHSGSQQLTSLQPNTMAIQQIPKIDSIFSYRPNALGNANTSSSATKICIDSVKDLSLGPSGSVVTSIMTTPSQCQPALGVNSTQIASSKTLQSIHTILLQNPPPYEVAQKGRIPGVSITPQGNSGQLRLATPHTLAQVTNGGNLVTAIGMAQQHQMTFPPVNLNQSVSLSSDHNTTSWTYTRVPQTSQNITQNWSNQIMSAGRMQTAATIQDDFLFQILQENKDPQGVQSQTNSTLTSVDHVVSDQPWTISIGM